MKFSTCFFFFFFFANPAVSEARIKTSLSESKANCRKSPIAGLRTFPQELHNIVFMGVCEGYSILMTCFQPKGAMPVV